MAETLLELQGLHVHYELRGGLGRRVRGRAPEILRAVDGVDLTIRRGETLGLVGESGCGKSTLGRAIVGLCNPTAGSVSYRGETLAAKRERSRRRRIQMVFQDPYSSLNPRMTVRQTLSELLLAHRLVPKASVEARCRELLDLVGLGSRALDAHPRQFSGGQRQRVAIARALALEPELLIADEPVSALDVSVQATVLNLLEELREKLGLTMLLIAHNMAVVRHVCRPRRGDVPRPDRRGGVDGRAVHERAASVHARVAAGSAATRSRPRVGGRGRRRGSSEPDRLADRLQVPSALPDRAGAALLDE